MNIHELADKEAERLDKQLEDGEITDDEYQRYMCDLRAELAEHERGG